MNQETPLHSLVINDLAEAENTTLPGHSIAPDKGQRMTKDMISVTMDTLVSKDEMTQEDTDDDFEDDTSYPGCSCCRPR